MLFERGVARTQEQVLVHFVALRLHQSGRLEDVGNKQATQFALFKAFASSNPRPKGGRPLRKVPAPPKQPVEHMSDYGCYDMTSLAK
jgi:hypothetical protein